MKILYTLNSSTYGGMEFHVLDLVKGFVSRGDKVFVWCPAGELFDDFNRAGARVYAKKLRFDFDPIYILSLYKFLRTHGVTVVHAHELKAVVNTMLAATLARVKIRISHTHTPISEWVIGESLYKKLLVWFYARCVNLLSTYEIALTDSRKRTKQKEGITNAKLYVIPNALKLENFSFSTETKKSYRAEVCALHNIPQTKFLFGNVNRLTMEKNVITLLTAYKQLLQDYPETRDTTHLLIAGGGEQENYLYTFCFENNISANITITGRFSEDMKPKYYASFDAFVLPSKAEGFGYTLIEAMAAGLPILASDIPVLHEVSKNKIVGYFDPAKPHQLMVAMFNLYTNLAANAAFYADLTREAVMTINKHYSYNAFIKNYADLYVQVKKI